MCGEGEILCVSPYPRKHEVFFGPCGLPAPDLPLALMEDTTVTHVTQHLYTPNVLFCFRDDLQWALTFLLADPVEQTITAPLYP